MLAFSTNNLAGFSAAEMDVLNDAFRQLIDERLDDGDVSDWYRDQTRRVTREQVLVLWAPGITADTIVRKARGTKVQKRGA